MTEVNVGDVIRVHWSNGAGYSDYLVDDSDEPHHVLISLGDYDTTDHGRPQRIDLPDKAL